MLPCMALRRKTSKLTAIATAVSLAMAPMSALAQQAKGPPVIRDTEAEQLLREYTRPIQIVETDRYCHRGLACHGADVSACAAGQGSTGHPRYRGRAVAARIYQADPAIGGAGKAEHPD